MPSSSTTAPITGFDGTPLKAAVHYVCWVCEDPRSLGPARLNRILWYTDRNVLLTTGRPLFGATFWKRPQGPVAKPLQYALSALINEGAVALRARSHAVDFEQYFAIKSPDLSVLGADHLSQLEAAIRGVCLDSNAPILRRDAHDAVLRAARVGEVLPPHTAFAGASADVHEEDLEWAANEARRPASEPNWSELEELRRVNRRSADAYKAVTWYLSREPEAGCAVPHVQRSAFFYKQQGDDSLGVPDIGVVYDVNLGELVLIKLRFDFPGVRGDNDMLENYEVR
jgi:hypothetical protein